ncbi:hypothetical protein PoB_007520900 [Plakobranchus ocellatus]|uniref:Uncharacterized protein n=1 Tax=Plakobranchus ocellatus TaxID=259542 RepID=A0AAV4DXB2_9GAST|nr:hypothetical protein PoB_007520900 [Plakobranchus ocellatus]
MLSVVPALATQRSSLIDKYLSLRELANIQKQFVVISLNASAKVLIGKHEVSKRASIILPSCLSYYCPHLFLLGKSGGGWSDTNSRVSFGGDGGDGSGDDGGNIGGSEDAIEGYSSDYIANRDGGGNGGSDGDGVLTAVAMVMVVMITVMIVVIVLWMFVEVVVV